MALAVLTPGCADESAKRSSSTSTSASTERQTDTSYAWSAATAMRRVGKAGVTLHGRPAKVDPSTLVCWGVGRSERRRSLRVWHRFDCIAPTFHGAGAGPDLLFTVEPTGATTYKVANPRLTSYDGG